MTAALALAVVLVIAVAGMSLAMQTQRPVTQAPRPSRTPPSPRRVRDRRPPTTTTPPQTEAPAPSAEPMPKIPELSRTGATAEAKVISVVDERTLGPVTRSRLNLRVQPSDGEPFEVTIRMAFSTPQARAQVRVGGTVNVRYDSDDHSRVVLDLAAD
ncbi:MAG: DUF3592 domain-containing protein [Actinomycetota bacterium]|nr:DUF3592 domain-containing protein [Actinomycetota bacterium]